MNKSGSLKNNYGDVDDIPYGNRDILKNGVRTRQSLNNKKTRLSLKGTAVLERENQPVLATSYQYLTDQASAFFEEDVEDFQNIELSKVAFGVRACRNGTMKNIGQQFNNGTVYKAASVDVYQHDRTNLSTSLCTSNYMWTLIPDKSEISFRNWISACNNFTCGFLSCMMLCLGYYSYHQYQFQ